MNQSYGNLLRFPSPPPREEWSDELLWQEKWRLERIVSTGQSTPLGEWLTQARAEWVVLLSGGAALRFEDESAPRELTPGDWVWIAPLRRHRVERTDPDRPSVWLALHHD